MSPIGEKTKAHAVTGFRFRLGGIFLLPALILAAAGAMFFRDGAALDAAFPVPLDLSISASLPPRAFQDAASSLAAANPGNGDAQISLAEARYYGAPQQGGVLPPLRAGLSEAPASAEGWTFYAEFIAGRDRRGGARALAQAFTLAPYEFFWAARRAHLAASLWDVLDSDTKKAALAEARTVWEEPELRDGMLLLLSDPEGAALMTRAYAGRPDMIRMLNRWVSSRQRQLRSGP